MTEKQLHEIEERANAASPGPWSWMCGGVLGDGCDDEVIDPERAREYEYIASEEDKDFIAHAREDIPYLLNENARLAARVKELKAKLEIAKRGYVDCMTAQREVDGKCLGYQKSEQDDEPCEQCKRCPQNTSPEL